MKQKQRDIQNAYQYVLLLIRCITNNHPNKKRVKNKSYVTLMIDISLCINVLRKQICKANFPEEISAILRS